MTDHAAASRRSDHIHSIRITLVLGIVLGGSIVLALTIPSQQLLAWYLLALCIFHFLEFYMTAVSHPEVVSSECIIIVSIVSGLTAIFSFSAKPQLGLHSVDLGLDPRIHFYPWGLSPHFPGRYAPLSLSWVTMRNRTGLHWIGPVSADAGHGGCWCLL